MDDLLLPALILAVVGIVGVTIFLVWYLLRNSKGDELTPIGINDRPSRSTTNAFLTVDRNEQGIWEIRVRGIPYRKLESVPDEEERATVIQAVKLLAAFSRDYLQKQRQQPETERAPSPAKTATGAPQRLSMPTPAPEGRDQNRLKAPAAPPTFMPRIDLAREIGEIVEGLQQRRPKLAEHSILLRNAPDGSINFILDGVTYRNTEDIPNLEVQALIREAIKIWERR